MRVNAAIPRPPLSNSIRISSVPYAEEEIPSGASTPSASTLDSRCSPSCSLTMGGPSRRRFSEYAKPSGRSSRLPKRPTAFRIATCCVPPSPDVAFIPPRAHSSDRQGHSADAEEAQHGETEQQQAHGRDRDHAQGGSGPEDAAVRRIAEHAAPVGEDQDVRQDDRRDDALQHLG